MLRYGIVILLICVHYIARSQNTGIGDVNFTPASYLHVHHNGATGINFQLTNTTSGLTAADGFQIDLAAGFDINLNNREAGAMLFSTSGTERIRILSTGNVGVGDPSPAALFTVGSGDLFQVISTGHARTINGTAAVPSYSFTGSTTAGMYSGGANILRFSTNSADRMTITATGNVGIGTIVPNAASLLEMSSTTSGLLIPRMTDAQRTAIVAPATGLLVYQTNGSTGFYYYDGAGWTRLSSAPANTEYWIRPVAAAYIHPIANTAIRVYDSGQTYGIWYDGAANQYAIYARTQSAASPTSAVVGFSDVAGNQTYGYLGYNGTYTDGTYITLNGAAVYGLVDDPTRTAVFGRTTTNASIAAVIGYSNVWIPGFFRGVHNNAAFAGRPGVYGGMTTTVAVADYESAVQGYSEYTGATNTGFTVGGSFHAQGANQDAYGVMGSAGCVGGTVWGVGVYGESSDNANGSDYYGNNIGAVEGNGAWNATTYNFGVIGRQAGTGTRSGGVMGTTWTTDYGALGYCHSSGTLYGLMYVGGGAVTSKGTTHTATHIGMGGYGDLMGGWVRGNVYGVNVMGERYGLYVHGKQFNNDLITVMNTVGQEELRVPTYAMTSMSVDVYSKGIATVVNGSVNISFDKSFRDLVSGDDPVIVTITPVGRKADLYLANVTTAGFEVIDATDGVDKTVPLTFTWIAVGTKAGYEDPQLPQELLPADYETKMEAVMNNEANPDVSGLPMWWNGSQLLFEPLPENDLGHQKQIALEKRWKNISLRKSFDVQKVSLRTENSVK